MVEKSYRAFYFKNKKLERNAIMFKTIDKSKEITEGLRESFHETECKMANRVCYGYNAQADGGLVINKEEARVVHWIFERYLEGYSFGKIAAGLEKQSIPSPTGKARWNREAISKLLSNEKYTGFRSAAENNEFLRRAV